MFSLLASWNEFLGTSMEVLLDSSVMGAAYRGYMRKNNRKEHLQEYNSAVTFISIGAGIKLPSGKWPTLFLDT
jgi:hypothetical protein